MNPEQLIPFWPHNAKDITARIRYAVNQITSSPFEMNQKHRTLLRMHDEERPAILIEITATDFDGVKIIFEDYKIGDAPLLISPNGTFDENGGHKVAYRIFIGGIQTVLLFSEAVNAQETVEKMPLPAESMILNATSLAINMNTDLKQIQRPLNAIIKAQIESPSSEIEMFFDNIHLSPLKVLKNIIILLFPNLSFYEQNNDKFTTTKITKEVTVHYQNQFMKQLHVLVLELDVLGNPLVVIRGLAEGVESFFYEPYKDAVQGPMEFTEGVATDVRGLANLTFDEDYKVSRIRRKEPGVTTTTHIAMGGKKYCYGLLIGFVDGVKGVVSKPIRGARHGGASGFFKGEGVIGLVARPTGGMVDFVSTSLDLIKR
ncbi:unnamed protein product [Rotaria magnacalcarata]|uniref:Uncharacterized protein n=1 Tax=Rotaria magnacalcarata TaxID=392030 RepID=A0A816N4Y3_9BILA|nr:unnamed protein product [Rotaria magnacalcarata]